MGKYSYATFQENLLFEIGNREDVNTLKGPWVNAAYLDFCTRQTFWDMVIPNHFYFPELLKTDSSKATAANVKFISTPADLVTIYHIHDTTSDHPLDYYEPREYLRKTGHNTSASYGKPTKWTRLGPRLYFHPTPNAVYALDITYRKRPSLMVNADDTTEIDALWDDPILKLAVIQTLYRTKRYDMADVEKKEWINRMAGKLGIYTQDKRSNRTPIEPDYTYKIAGRVI